MVNLSLILPSVDIHLKSRRLPSTSNIEAPPTDTSEKGFQKLIANYLINENGYVESYPNDFDREFCINTKQLLKFIEVSRKEKYKLITNKGKWTFLVRLDEKTRSVGVKPCQVACCKGA